MKKIRLDIKVLLISSCFIAVIGYLLYKVHVLEAMSTSAMAESNLVLQDDDHIRGSKNAQVIIFEFSDYECPFCEKIHPELQKAVDEYKGKVAWVFKYFPLSSHPHAEEKAAIGECVAKLAGEDSFWKFTDDVFDGGTDMSVSDVKKLAGIYDVTGKKLEDCIVDTDTQQKIQNDKQLGQQYGVSGTPGNIILNTKTGETTLIPGALPYESLKTVIDKSL